MPQVSFCFDCWPGGPVVPPPCIKCGSRDYFHAGLCVRCHILSDPGPDSCLDCLAWGATRTHQWLCLGCVAWRNKYRQPRSGGGIGTCRTCGRTVMLGARGICRLCHKQTEYYRIPGEPYDPIAANKHGQQLFFADMFFTNPRHGGPGPARQEDPGPVEPRDWTTGLDNQPALFTATPDLASHGRAGLHRRANPEQAAMLERIANHLADEQHWTTGQRRDAIIGARIAIGIQDNGRGPVPASHVEALRQIDLTGWTVREVLQAADLLIEDRTPALDAWFHTQIAPLPSTMQAELEFWFDIRKNGSFTTPRSRPRSPVTLRLHASWALPALLAWASEGHQSLREITRDDVLAQLPTGPERARMGQGLKSVFRVLKAHKKVFQDPTSRTDTGSHPSTDPLPLDINVIIERLDSSQPETAAITALAVFHGLRMGQIRALKLTDLHDGKLYLDDRVIPLADPVKQRLSAYITQRNTLYPDAPNPHLFLSRRSWRQQGPCSARWVRLALGPGITTRKLREDRILHEAIATGGDVRALSDLFGLSIQAATRFTRVFNADTIQDPLLTRTHDTD